MPNPDHIRQAKKKGGQPHGPDAADGLNVVGYGGVCGSYRTGQRAVHRR